MAKGHSVIAREHDGGGGAMLRLERPPRVHDAEDHVPERGGERLSTAEMRDAVRRGGIGEPVATFLHEAFYQSHDLAPGHELREQKRPHHPEGTHRADPVLRQVSVDLGGDEPAADRTAGRMVVASLVPWRPCAHDLPDQRRHSDIREGGEHGDAGHRLGEARKMSLAPHLVRDRPGDRVEDEHQRGGCQPLTSRKADTGAWSDHGLRWPLNTVTDRTAIEVDFPSRT